MADRLNQHYVPQFYFRHFSLSGRTIGLLLVRSGQVIPRASIRGQCSRKNFYGTRELESEISRLEAKLCEGIRAGLAVANSASAPMFSPEELVWFYDSIVFQRARTATEVAKHAPALQDMLLFMFRAHLEQNESDDFLREFDKHLSEGNIKITESDASSVGRSVQVMLENAPLIRDLSICFLRNRTDYPFLFSDSPVVFYNTYAKAVKNRGVIGLQSPGLQVFFPLDNLTCAMLYDPARYDGPFRGWMQYDLHERSDVSQLNALQLHHALDGVYFGNPEDEAYVADLWNAHARTLAVPASECRVNPNLWVDGKPAEGDLVQVMEPQLDFDLRLSFIECDPVSQADYVYRPRSPDLAAWVKEQCQDSGSGG